MASYIITLDKTHYTDNNQAETAILDTGAVIVKNYQYMSFTFLIDADETQVAAISNVTDSQLAETVLPAYHATTDFTIPHLIASIDGGDWTPKFDGTGTVVYLMDTGVNPDHAEFTNSTIVDLYKNDYMESFIDNEGHGTGIASTIVGENVGTAPKATLKNVKLFDGVSQTVSVQEIVDALDAILQDHNITPGAVKVVCMPWSVAKNSLVDAKLGELQDANLVLVASAGNNSGEVNDYSPGGLDTILTVGAMSCDGLNTVAAFNNLPRIQYVDDETTGVVTNKNELAEVDLFAAGINVNVADVRDSANYVIMSGSSISAGLSAGAVAHYIQNHGTATAEQIKSYVVTAAYNSAIADGNLDYSAISAVEDGTIVDFANINYGVLRVPELAESNLSAYPPGRICDVQLGQSQTIEMNFLADATDIAVLDFSPLPPWMTLDVATGHLVIDVTAVSADLAPGVYNFAIKGTIAGSVLVEEYSVGLYVSDSNEVYEANEYYYDQENDSYDEVIVYESASSKF